jgi:hypothetical protein
MQNHFYDAGIASNTDKVTYHRYDLVYPHLLSFVKNGDPILEIGYGEGCGIQFWKSIYPDSFLFVLDKDHEHSGEGYKVIKCDQSSVDQLQTVYNLLLNYKFGLIIDDGSHLPSHQILTFQILFPLLRPFGSYVIEDIETSFWRYGSCYSYPVHYGLRSKASTISVFSTLFPRWINKKYLSGNDKKSILSSLRVYGITPAVADMVLSISFGPNCIHLLKRDPSTSDPIKSYRYYRHVEPSLYNFLSTYFGLFFPLVRYLHNMFKTH